MSISRTKPDFALGGKLTSAEVDAIDTNTTYALDKRSGETDTLESTVALSGAINVGSGGSINVGATGSINANVSGAKVAATASGAVIEATAAGSKVRVTGSAVFEAPTATSYTITPAASRTIVRSLSAIAYHLGSGWTRGNFTLKGGTSGNEAHLNPPLIDGATLSSITLIFYATAHAGIPANLPSIFVNRRSTDGSLIEAMTSSEPVVFPTPGSVGAYSSTLHTWTIPITVGNVIDTSAWRYQLRLVDESGTNSVANNDWESISFTYTNITSLRPA